jgi:hypothetical protein
MLFPFLFLSSKTSFAADNPLSAANGLPEATGTIITKLASNPKVAGEFYAVNNHGVYVSTDSGVLWRELEIQWPKEYLSQHLWALIVGNN